MGKNEVIWNIFSQIGLVYIGMVINTDLVGQRIYLILCCTLQCSMFLPVICCIVTIRKFYMGILADMHLLVANWIMWQMVATEINEVPSKFFAHESIKNRIKAAMEIS